MTNHYRSSTVQTNRLGNSITAKKRTLPPPLRDRRWPLADPIVQKPKFSLWQGNWPATLASIAAISGVAGMVCGGAWLSWQMIFNPEAANWQPRFLPAWSQVPISTLETPQTLTQIEMSVLESGKTIGEAVPVKAADSPHQPALLIPILEQQAIAEIRVYQPVGNSPDPDLSNATPTREPSLALPLPTQQEQFYQLVSKLPINGPAESFVIDPLITSNSDRQGSSHPLPLTKIQPFSAKVPTNGVWLNLTGEHKEGDTKILYGQVIHYNPSVGHLSVMLPWTSPAGEIPTWQEVTGGGEPELMVDQSQGLEPLFLMYQIKPRKFALNPLELDPIVLTQPALSQKQYKDALLLAKNQLWSPALQLMAGVKQQYQQKSQPFSAAAQAQLDLILYHAKITQTQASAPWSTPRQQAIAELMDGRWKDALQVFEAALEADVEMVNFLVENGDRLWEPIEATLRVNPDQADVKAWGALIIAARENRDAAIAWMLEQNSSSATDNRILDLLDQLMAAKFDAETASNHPSKIVGSVEAIAEINPIDWLTPKRTDPLELAEGQVWYRVQVAGFHDGKAWMRSPFTNLTLPEIAPARRLWKQLGLHADAQIQILSWMPNGEKRTTVTTVKALRLNNGTLELLTLGAPLPGVPLGSAVTRPMGLTTAALKWLEPQMITLAELAQNNPQWVAAILPALWQELQRSGQVTNGAMPDSALMLQQLGNWLVQSVDLTGNDQPDAVLTLRSNTVNIATPTGNTSQTRTLIFDETGALIYSDPRDRKSASRKGGKEKGG